MLLTSGSGLGRPTLAAGLLALGLSFLAEGSEALHVAGQVIAPPGQGLADAEVVLLPVETAYREAVRLATGEELQPVARVVADRNGRFAIEVPAPGMWRLVARSEGRLPLVRHELPLTESHEAPPAELPLDEGVTVTVLGPFGPPVAGAQVRVVAGRGGLSGGGWSAWRETVTTNSAGRARVPAAAGESVVLAAWADGFVEGRARGRSGESVELRLGYGEPTRLQVVDHQDQRGVDRAPLGAGVFQATITDAEGWATLVMPPRMSEAWWEGEQGGRGSGLAPGHELGSHLPLRLPAAVELRGRVLAEDGTPVGSAVVWVDDDRGGAVLSAPDGRFRLRVPRQDWVARGQDRVVLRAASGSMGALTILSLGEAEAAGVAVTVRDLWEATGSVVDERGRPVGGARVEIRRSRDRIGEEPDPSAAQVRTDRSGRFTIPRLIRDEILQARAVSPRGVSDLVSLGDSPTEIVVATGSPIEGQVRDLRGTPVPEATVRAFSGAGLMMRMPAWDPRALSLPDREVRSDRDGRFVVSGLPEGDHLLEVEAPGMGLEIVQGVSTIEGAELEPIVLVPLAAVEGVVVDSTGEPIAGARVLATAPGSGMHWQFTDDFYQFGTTSDAGGRFRVGPFRTGSPVAVTAGAAGFSYACQKDVEAPADGLRLVVPPLVELAGSLVDSAGRPRGGVPVSLRGAATDCRTAYGHRAMALEIVTGADGMFRFQDLPPGTFQVSVPAQDALGAAAASVELVAGEPPPAIELRVEQKAVVIGRVLGFDGEPVPGALVGVERPPDGDSEEAARPARVSPTTHTDAEGRFRLAGLDPGAAVLLAADGPSDLTRQEVVLELGEQEIDVRLEARTLVAGWVTGTATQPMAGATVLLVGEDETFAVEAGATGEFLLADIPEGSYRLSATLGDERGMLQKPVEVVPGRPVVGLRIELGGFVAGRVAGLGPAELAKVEVSASPLQRNGIVSSTRPDEGGFFFLAGLDPGQWLVTAELEQTGQYTYTIVTITPGEDLEPVMLALGGGLELSGEVPNATRVGTGLNLILRGDDLRREAPVAPEGSFRLTGLPPGDFELAVFAEYGGPLVVAAVTITTVGAEVFDLALGGYRVSGRVVDQAGWPVVSGSVRIQPAEAWWGDSGDGAPLDEDGRFTLPLVPDGQWELRLNGHPASATLEIEVAGQDVEGLEMLATSGR